MNVLENDPKDDELPPSDEVLQAFRAYGEPKRLMGGEGKSYVVGKVVLKPTVHYVESIWRADLLSRIPQHGFRLATPVKANDGHWVYEGWEASVLVEGEETKERAREKIEVSRTFHSALRPYDKPSFIERATHPWAVADRMVWGEQKLEYGDRLQSVVGQLLEMLKPIELPNQLIHGDMTGNILFHEGLDPAIIDFSPYWRPAEYATAIIVVDSIIWNKESDSFLETINDTSEMNQLLVRATLWRIKTTEEFIKQFGKGSIDDVEAYTHFIDLLKKRNL